MKMKINELTSRNQNPIRPMSDSVKNPIKNPSSNDTTNANVVNTVTGSTKYWRSSEYRSVGGAGLGLYLVKLVAEAHGGAVEARALPGSINSFSFEFPLRTPTSTP